ncbi:phage major capsid protein [Rahnella inusitata]|uniref:phage major capsid protein n=1 Tax=Rahnella inusitata TaxID=58169 RepID=UPI001BC8601E|nr:phage major capsid protein [Rahnella inusitata]QUT14133.1 phage major capsid protein [Rahnella inusitata]
MTLNRACTLMTIKAVNEDDRIITGIASTPSPDRDGDIMEPEGAKFRSDTPFLWQHDRTQPIGSCTPKMVKEGLQITAKLVKPTPDMPSQLAARLDEAWASIKSGLVKGLSIGFRPIEYSYLDEGGIRFLSWDLLEVSAVTIPANAECNITTVKSYDRQLLAASGNEKPVVKSTPSAGATAKKPNEIKGKNMNIAEQIKSFEAKRAALAASLNDVMSKAADDGRTLDLEETEQYDNVSSEVKAVDDHLKRLRDMENNMASTAKPVAKAAAGEVTTVDNRAPGIIRVEQKLEKGVAFARFTKALAVAKGVRSEALQIAKNKYPEDTKLHHVLKAAVNAGTTTDPEWAGSLVEYQDFANDFVDFLRPKTIIGQFGVGNIPSLRDVPFNIRVPVQTSGGSAQWVGQGKAKPLTKFDFETITFGFSKVAAISVLTEELLRFSNPKADVLVRDSLAESVIARLDLDFVDPLKAAQAGVSPASITNGATTIASTGDPDADSTAAFQVFIDANLQPTGAVWLMSSSTALALSKRKTPLGAKEYPDMTMFGGTYEGLPAIVSQYVGNQIILMNAPDIYLADDGGVAVDMSSEASLEMESAPTGDSVTPTGVELVSMWQTNSVAIRAERWINWQRRRTAAVAVISGVNYGSGQTS